MRRVRIIGFGSEERQLMVYVLNTNGEPLMPTSRYGKVRHLLKDGKAIVVQRCPFTIQLQYETCNKTQPVSLGVDAGSKHVGLSATSAKKELYAAEADLRNDISNNLTARKEIRRNRRNRKTRYRKARFDNRVHDKQKGWLAPSVQQKCDNHIQLVKKVMRILPIAEIHVEMAPFDIQLLKAELLGLPIPSGEDYQHGESEGYDNIKAYVKWRDGYRCKICGSRHMLQVHHKKQRKDGGTNAPWNLITVCPGCHQKFHAGLMHEKDAKKMLPDSKPKTADFKDASFMGIMRWTVWDRLKTFGLPLYMIYGYQTSELRKEYNVKKSHHADARCISGHPDVQPSKEWFYLRKVRCHNRQIHKLTIQKGGSRKRNQAPYLVNGFRLYDQVSFAGQECFIFGRRSSGYFVLRKADGTKVHSSTSYRKLKLLHTASHQLIERRPA